MIIKNFLLVYKKKETYMNLIYIFIISTLITIIYSFVLYPLIITGVVTSIFLIGIILLIMAMFIVRLFALFDRIVLNLVLDADIHEPDGLKSKSIVEYVKEIVLSKQSWYDIIYIVVIKPVFNTFVLTFSVSFIALFAFIIASGVSSLFLAFSLTMFSYIFQSTIVIVLALGLLTFLLHSINYIMNLYVDVARFFLHDDDEYVKEKNRKGKLKKYTSNIYKERSTQKVKTRKLKKQKRKALSKR